MDVKDVLSRLIWKRLTDWSTLTTTYKGSEKDFAVSKEDLDVFVDFIIQDIAIKLQTNSKEIRPIFQKNNKLFYDLMREYFRYPQQTYATSDTAFLRLQSTLMVPNTDAILESKLDMCTRIFEELSDDEKVKFLEKIGKVTIKVYYN